MIRVFSRKTGAARDVTPEEGQALYQGGEWAPRARADIPVAGPNGELGYVKGAMLGSALDAGWTFTAPEAVRHAEVLQRHSGLGSTLGAGAAGVARGLTLGLSDVAASAVGGAGARDWLSEAQEAHPYVSTAGEVVGAVAPVLLSGGGAAPIEGANIARAGATAARGVEAARALEAGLTAGKVAKGAIGAVGAPARLAAGAGDIAELGARAIVGHGNSLVTKALTKGIALGARGAVEGGIYGAAGQVSEAALGDHELNAEKVLAAVGHGALMGAATGGVLGGASEVAAAGLRKVAPAITKAAGEQAWKALDPIKKYTLEAEARAGGAANVGQTLLRYKVPTLGADIETMVPRITDARAKVGGMIGDLVGASTARVSGAELLSKVDDIVRPLEMKAGHEAIATSLRGYRQSLGEHLGLLTPEGAAVAGHEAMLFSTHGGPSISIQDLLAQRKALDEIVYGEAKALDPKLRVALLREVRGAMEKLETKAIDEAGEAVGSAERGTYKALKRDFQHLSLAEKAAEDTTARMQTNRNFSLTDYGAAGIGMLSGHGALGLAAGLANNIARARGNSTLAVTLDRIAGLGVVRQAIADTDRRLAAGVDGFFEQSARRRVRVHRVSDAGPDTETEYRDRVKSIEQMQTEPQRAAKTLHPLIEHTPKTANALMDLASTSSAYLASKIPAGHMPDDSLTPQLARPSPTAADMAKFNRVARAVDDPLSILTSMQRGTLTSDEVQAVKDRSPKLYAQMQTSVTSALASQKKPLDPSRETQVRLLFGLRTGILDPGFVSMCQGTHGPAQPGPSAPQGRPSSFTPHTEIRTAAQIASQPGK